MKYHFWSNDQEEKTIDSDYIPILGNDMKFNDDLFCVKSCLTEMKNNGDVVLHYNCFKKQ